MSDPRYESPIDQNGLISPPPSTKTTKVNPASPTPSMALPRYLPQMPSQSPNPQQMTVYQYHQGMQVASPPQMNTTPASPYPTPSSKSSMDVDSQRWQAFLEFERQQQLKQFSQAPPNMMAQQPAVIPQRMQQPDSGYGTGQFRDLGQQHGLPGQQPQPHTPRPGHRYGIVTASGNARVVRGNVKDARIPKSLVTDHIYGDAYFSGKANILDGDVTGEAMNGFWNRN